MLANIVLSLTGLMLAVFALAYANKVREVQRALTALNVQASTDPLTNVLNRRAFLETFEQRFGSGDDLHILYIDLANFKEVNDKFGHSVGDGVLCNVADHLQSLVQDDGIIGRLGGDEFCIVRCGGNEDEALSFARAMYESPCRLMMLDEQAITVEFSIGVAFKDETCATAEELLRRSDRAMYEAKSMRSGPVFFHAGLDNEKVEKRQVRRELRGALSADQLELHYQPVFSARTGKIAGLEALMRWPNKTGPAGSPGVFIPIAEESDLILELGHWSLKAVLAEIKKDPARPISLNLSARQLLQPNFARLVADEIIAAGVSSNLLKFELTETVLIEHTETACRVLRQLREIGVQLLLDDFGTGYSSLSYLQKFKFDILKIDRAFVREINNGVAGQNLMRAIINMGRSLDMKIVAEGVETGEQAAILQLLNADFLQGFFLGVPMPADQLASFNLSDAASDVFKAA